MNDSLWAWLVFFGTVLASIVFYRCGKYFGEHCILYHAGIASQLTPRANWHISNHSSIFVVGADSTYLARKRRWRAYLRKWLKRGCRVDYLVSDPPADAQVVLEALRDEFPKQFQFRNVLNQDKIDDLNVKEKVRQLESFHFVLFDSPRQIWVEGNHPREELKAYECEYVPPRLARTDKRFEEYQAIFSDIWENYSS